MKAKSNHRLVALAVAVAGSVLLQACASVTTGQFVPNRELKTNRTMTSNYDQYSHQLKTTNSTGSRFRIVSSAGGGVYDYRYY